MSFFPRDPVMKPLPLSSYSALKRDIYPYAPGVGTSVVFNPANVMLAYDYAARVSPNRQARLRAIAAMRNWQADMDDIMDGFASGSLAQSGQVPRWIIATARWRARQQGVGALFDAAVGEVAAADAIEKAEAATGEEATPADESFLSWAWARMREQQTYNREVLDSILAHSPSGVARHAASTMAETWKDMVMSAGRAAERQIDKNREALTDQMDKTRDAAERIAPDIIKDLGGKTPRHLGTAAIVTTGAVVLLGFMWWMPRMKG